MIVCKNGGGVACGVYVKEWGHAYVGVVSACKA